MNALTMKPEGPVLGVAGVARFFIRDGMSIVVDPDPPASDRDARMFVFGSALGAILHQRRLLPFHANTVDIHGHAIPFMGRPGAGESTLAAAFHDRGHRLLASSALSSLLPFGIHLTVRLRSRSPHGNRALCQQTTTHRRSDQTLRAGAPENRPAGFGMEAARPLPPTCRRSALR